MQNKITIEPVSKVIPEPTPAYPASPERFAEASGHPSEGGELSCHRQPARARPGIRRGGKNFKINNLRSPPYPGFAGRRRAVAALCRAAKAEGYTEARRGTRNGGWVRKKTFEITSIVYVLISLAAIIFLTGGCGKSESGQQGHGAGVEKKAAKYHCPMHPTVVSDKPGDCPICGMRLVPIEKNETAKERNGETAQKKKETANGRQGETVRKEDESGERRAESGNGSGKTPAGLAAITITPEVRQRMGLTFGVVEKRPLARQIRTSARIVADETRLYRVTTKVEGWVEKLFVNVTGQLVRQGDPLLTLYSPELVSAQQEYLSAAKLKATAVNEPAGDARKAVATLLDSARRRLQLWDISDEQIVQLEKRGQPEKFLTLYSPAGGWLLERMVLPGQKIMPNEPLMVVGDLSNVWGDADIYESDLPYVKTGMVVEITLPYWPDKMFKGTISFITPTLDPETRTLRARLEIANPDLALKPEMFANALLQYELGERLVVPEQAVMRTGLHNYVFRAGAGGKLIPTKIKLGARGDGYYEVLSGLNAGDKVVTSANFLVDSESSMKAALEALAQQE